MRRLLSGFVAAGALTALFFAANIFLLVPALAVPLGRVLEWKTGMSTVTFDGRAHAEKGLRCSDCHPKPFMMLKGYAKMKMVEIIAGKYCGECHNGKRAFPSDKAEKCAKCHKM